MKSYTEGNWGKGIFVALMNALVFIVVPLLIKNYDIDVNDFKLVISEEFLTKWIMCGVPITIISFFTGFYENGNVVKVYATAIQVVIAIIALFYIFSVDVNNVVDVTIKSNIHVSVSLAIAGMLVLISVSKILKFLIVVVDYYDYK